MRICTYIIAAGLLLSSLQLIAQVPDPVVAAQAPVPGSGHQYIGIGAETVNPADGSLSFDLPFKPPTGRGLSMNFGIRFSGTEQFSLSNTPPGGQSTLSFTPNWQHGQAPWQIGAWSYDLPIVTARTSVYTTAYVPNNGCPNGICSYSLNFCWGSDSYVFRGLDGTQTSLPIGTIYNDANNYQQNFCGVTPAQQSPGNKHGILSYLLGGTQVEVVDHSGTTYQFPSVEGAEPQQPSMYPSMGGALATTITDRNGNQITLSGNTSYKDATGRTAVSWTGIGNSGDQISVAGLSGPVTLQWITTPVSFPETGYNINGGTCNLSTPSTSVSVVSEIDLPNSTKYLFQYDGTYGKVSKITFPSGGYVRYVWGLNTSAALTHASWNANNTPYSCDFIFDVPAVTDRYVSFDGSNEVLHQHFQYSTSWSGASWTSKQTIVTATDLVTGQVTKTTYNYGPVQGDNNVYISVNPLLNQIPVETNVVYQDGAGSTTYKTVNKTWMNPHIMLGEQTILDNGQGSATERCYDANEQITNLYEYGFQSEGSKPADPSCYSSNIKAGSLTSAAGPLRRQTTTAYHSFFQWNGSTNPPIATGTHIVNAPDSVTVADGSNVTAKQTLYTYDQNGLQGSGAIYLTNPSSTRANITTLQRLISGSSYATTTYSYWDTGQLYSMTDPCGNTTCSDMIGTHHTTYYHYSDSYQSGTGTPPGQTNAYLTEVDYPDTGVAHTLKFTWGYTDGQLRSSVDENNQTTSYAYNDSLARLTQISYPDTGQTTVSYNDTPYSPGASTPNFTVTQLVRSGTSKSTETVFDGLGHTVNTFMINDPDCSSGDRTDTTYDGFGRTYTVKNPYCQSSDPTYGVTTYAYDVLGRTTQITRPDGSTVLTSYTGRAKKVQDEGNGTQRVVRISQTDGLGRLASVCEVASGPFVGGGGASSSSLIGQDGTPVACNQDMGATGFLTAYNYDTLGNLTQVNQGTIAARSFSYDMLSRLLTTSNPESGTICYGTWSGGQCISGYDANGNLSSRTDARSIVTSYTYDTVNRVKGKSYTDSTPSVTYNYDETAAQGIGLNYTTGRISSESTAGTYPTGAVFSYDQMGRVKDNSQCTPQNCGGTPWRIGYGYDLAGDMTSASNGMGVTLTYNFSSAMRLQSVLSSYSDGSHPGTLVSGITYNAAGDSVSATLGNGASESIGYDSRLRLHSVSAASSGSVTIGSGGSVSINGNLQSKQVQTGSATSGTGSVTISGSEQSVTINECPNSYPYNCWNTIYDGGYVSITVNGVTDTVYYGSGTTGSSSVASALASAINGDGSSPVTASASGSIVYLTAKSTGAATNYSLSATSATQNTQYFSSPSFGTSTSGSSLTGGHDTLYTTIYDSGSCQITVDYHGDSSSWSGSGTSGSSIAASLASIINGDSGAFVTASASGNTVNLAAKSGQSGSNYPLSASCSYDASNFSSASFTAASSGSSTVYSVSLGYAPNSDVVSANDSVNGSWSYGYDPFNRLICANVNNGTCAAPSNGSPTYNYVYDRFGNRWQQNGPWSMILTFTGNNPGSPNNNNRIDQSGSAYQYDAAGDLLTDANHSYQYDAEGRIKTVDNGTTATYVYDAEGRRVRKISGGVAVDYLYDLSGHEITEINSGGGWNRGEVYADGKHLATYNLGTTYFIHSDWLGTERARTTVSGGLYETCTSLPFGDGLSCSGANDTSPMHFTGKQRDFESGLDNFGARYDSSSIGRFMTPDWSAKPTGVPYAQFGDPQSLNLYTYVRNDAVTSADVDGHQNCHADADGVEPLICQLDGQAEGEATKHEDQLNNQQTQQPLNPFSFMLGAAKEMTVNAVVDFATTVDKMRQATSGGPDLHTEDNRLKANNSSEAAGMFAGGILSLLMPGSEEAKAGSVIEHVFENPAALLKINTEAHAAELGGLLEGQGWKVGKLEQGTHAGQGMRAIEMNTAGNATDRAIFWHPGGGRHGASPYYKISSARGGTIRIGPQFLP